MSTIKLIVILIALVVVVGMILKHLAQSKTKDMIGKFTDNSLEGKRLNAQKAVLMQPAREDGKTQRKELAVRQDIARNPYKAGIARVRGEAVASSFSAVADSELAKPIGQAAGLAIDTLSGAYEIRAITDATAQGAGLLVGGQQRQLSGPTGPVSVEFFNDEEL